jgi:magnesium transporter
VVIRGISVGVPMRHVVAGELMSGLIIGLLIAAAFVPFAYLLWGNGAGGGDGRASAAREHGDGDGRRHGSSLRSRPAGGDPAFGSGPLATAVQDLLSIVIYFAIAVALAP